MRTFSKTYLFFGALVAGLSTAGFRETALIGRHDVSEQAYIGFADQWPHPLVMARAPQGAANGHGTRISDEWIVTAAHVATDTVSIGAPLPGHPSSRVEEIHVHPGWPSEGVDLAIVRVSGLAQTDQVPICQTAPEPGDRIILVGQGDIGDGLTGPVGFEDQMRAAENRIDEVTPVHIIFDLTAGREALALEGVSGPGDSGGPAYLQTGSGVCLAGVSAGQDTYYTGGLEGRYGAVEYYTNAHAFRAWIQAELANAAASE